MSKFTTIFTISLLLTFMLSYAARDLALKTDSKQEKVDVEVNCEGLGEEECLIRRTLAAHVDYIYTCGKKPSSQNPCP
ncbi:hypothetical protein Tsubulata_037316 [Turnera subulata]|uniref:Phytosulfokine n=1 Tax=Turnera subulata TaxID=218843 RepID=A0A9Q0FWP6_9ROSI|nr:hypothetical protein Tsubulata_037316 [Turnera subulata]